MKKIILSLLLVFHFSTALLAQRHLSKSNNTDEAISPPKFHDKKALTRDIRNSELLNSVYLQLKSDTAGVVFQYTFTIDDKGHVNLQRPESDEILIEVNKFVETRFKNYRWSPAHLKKCKTCNVKSEGAFVINFSTERQEIRCYIQIYTNTNKIITAFLENVRKK